MPYCGAGIPSAQAGQRATSARTCKSRIGLYGLRVLTQAERALLKLPLEAPVVEKDGNYCGGKVNAPEGRSNAPYEWCGMRQTRLFGLLPLPDDAWRELLARVQNEQNPSKRSAEYLHLLLNLAQGRRQANDTVSTLAQAAAAEQLGVVGQNPAGASELPTGGSPAPVQVIAAYPAALTAEQEQIVQAMLDGAPEDVIHFPSDDSVNTSQHEFAEKMLLGTGRDRWINDDIVNAYFQTLKKAHDVWEGRPGRIIVINNHLGSRLPASNRKQLVRWVEKIKKKQGAGVFNEDGSAACYAVLLPLHVDGNHWVLACYFARVNQLIWYDSYGDKGYVHRVDNDPYFGYGAVNLAQLICDLISLWYKATVKDKQKREEFKGPELVNGVDEAIQTNQLDCGVFVCEMAKRICMGWIAPEMGEKHLPRQEDMPRYRRRMTYELLTGKVLWEN